MSFYVFLCVSFLPLSFWRTRGLTWLKALLAFKYLLEPGIFFSFGWKVVPAVLSFIILYNECLKVAVFHFTGMSSPHFYFPL